MLDSYAEDVGFDRELLDAAIADFRLTPRGTANFQKRWRRNDGMTPGGRKITLSVHFINGDASLHRNVQRYSNNWLSGALGTKLQFKFGVRQSQSQIAIHFGPGGNKSLVGRESANVAPHSATMNLESQDERAVTHEFGHALGLSHEHQNPSVPIVWNKPAVIRDMAREGWSRRDCEENIFNKFGRDYECVRSGAFDVRSVMLYPIPSHWTLNGFSSTLNSRISPNDRDCVVGLYTPP
ncbi:M12 family metallopeptidase [Flaviflagellibacter deserti]|uniref:M12 family metallopeptidase n=1 Tax=Flaviflagellibacter deserti TaxID=2267266 RepID=A0ABV9Z1F3_9HYPH